MNKPLHLCALLILASVVLSGQTTLNAELQIYPTGLIPGIRFEKQFTEKTAGHIRVGVNLFDHRDLGVQSNERGSGFGFTLGASRRLSESSWSLGLRNDIWYNQVKWDDITAPSPISSETKIVVLQPTAELTYGLSLGSLSVRPSLALGLEWNVITEGSPTGEGPILLIGVIVGPQR